MGLKIQTTARPCYSNYVLGSVKFCHLSFIYIQQCKSNNVVKKKKFNIRACNMHGLITYIKEELLNQDLEKLDVGNFLFTKQTWYPI